MRKSISLMAMMMAAAMSSENGGLLYSEPRSKTPPLRNKLVIKPKVQIEREFSIKGHVIKARSKKDAIIRAKHQEF